MHLEGQFTVAADRAAVYDFLTDPARVSRYMPDVEHVDIQDNDNFSVKARVGISHIKGTMVMKLAITDRRPPISTTVVGQGTGLASVVDMVTGFTLDTDASGGTIVNWQGDVKVSGKLAAFGPQGLLDRMGKKNVDRFIAGIKSGIEELTSDTPAAAPAPSAS